jgi:hypothetical protein
MPLIRNLARGALLLSAPAILYLVVHCYLLLQVRNPSYPYYAPAPLLFPEWFKYHPLIGKLVGRNPLYASYDDAFMSHLFLMGSAVIFGFGISILEVVKIGIERISPLRHAILIGLGAFLPFHVSLHFAALRLVKSIYIKEVPVVLIQSMVYALAAGLTGFLAATLITQFLLTPASRD